MTLILGVTIFPLQSSSCIARSEHVIFRADILVASGSFGAYVSSSDGSVVPSGSTTITFFMEQDTGSLTIDLGSYGNRSIFFNTPLSSISIPVSGVSGIASVNVILNGVINGYLKLEGPGSLSSNHIQWDSWGERSVKVNTVKAEVGDNITITLTLEYSGTIRAKGETIFGDVTIFPPQSFSGIEGSTKMKTTIKVKEKGIDEAINGFELVMLIVTIAAGSAVLLLLKERT